MFSFENGVARNLGADHRPIGKTFAVRKLQAVLVRDDAVFGLCEKLQPATNDKRGLTDDDTDVVLKLDAITLAVRGACRAPGVRDLVGFDRAGRVVAVSENSIVLIDPEAMAIVATAETDKRRFARGCSCQMAGPSTVAAPLELPLRRSILVIEWDEDAVRPIVATTPLPPKPAGTTDVVCGREVRSKQTFDNIRLAHNHCPLGGMDFDRCVFSHCSLNGTAGRIIVRDVRLERCTTRGFSARNVVFEDCAVSHAKATFPQFFFGCAFKHVVLRGKVGWNPYCATERGFRVARPRGSYGYRRPSECPVLPLRRLGRGHQGDRSEHTANPWDPGCADSP